MKEKTLKEKKLIAPNECSFLRWIIVILIGFGIATIIVTPFGMSSFAQNHVDTILGITYADFFGILSFIPLTICVWLALKFVAKTSMKDFILGVGGKINKKECLLILGLYVLGFLIPCLITLNNIHVRGVNTGHYAFLILFMLLTTWIQTTFEELVFRGIFLRWACKNNIGYTKKAWIAAVMSSLVFAVAHITNPEVTTQSGWKVVLAVVSYTIPGFVYFWADMHFGSLLPGIIMHWINNFILFTLISGEVSAVAVPTLLIDATPGGAVWSFTSTVLLYLPVVVYILIDLVKRKKAASRAN